MTICPVHIEKLVNHKLLVRQILLDLLIHLHTVSIRSYPCVALICVAQVKYGLFPRFQPPVSCIFGTLAVIFVGTELLLVRTVEVLIGLGDRPFKLNDVVVDRNWYSSSVIDHNLTLMYRLW